VFECVEASRDGGGVREISLIKNDQKGKRDLSVGLKFQVADVRKPLLAVSRVVEKVWSWQGR
jgi:sorbitol-specific phosphotransferase system component IIA